MKKKLLILLRNYNQRLSKSNRIFFLGRWCIPFNQEKNVNLKNCNKYHWANIKKRKKDYKYLKKLYERIIPALSKKLNKIHSKNLTEREWRLIIGHWLMIFITKTFDSHENLFFFIKNKMISKIDVRFFKIKNEDIISKNYFYFSYNSLNDFKYNQYIYQNIILNNFKNRFNIKYSKLFPEKKKNYQEFPKVNFFLKSFKKIMNIISPYRMPKTFFELSYINLINKFKLIVLLKNISYPPSVNDFFNSKIDKKTRKEDINFSSSNKFEKFLNFNILKYLPKSYIEDFEKLYSSTNKFNTNFRKVFSTGSYISNDYFKIWLSKIIKKGGKFFIMYHGGGIPSVHTIIHDHDNGVSNKVLVWHKAIDKKQKQMANLVLKEKILKRKKDIILLTLEPNTSFYPVKTDSGPVSSLFLDDLEQKCNLANFLIKNNQKLKFRITNPLVWDYNERLTQKFGNRILDNNEKFYDSLKFAKVHVSGYLSTTFSESINLNVPTVGLIEKKFYYYSNKFDKLLKYFETNNILFSDSKKLVKFLKKNNYDLEEWWRSNKITKIIDIYKNDVLGQKNEGFKNWKKIIL